MLHKIVGFSFWAFILASCTQLCYADTATFAMGRYWSAESYFRSNDNNSKITGITDIQSGYTGGTGSNPTYESHNGFREAVKIMFDPLIISYEEILDLFWHGVDPFDKDGQFCDKGPSYLSAIYYSTPEQKKAAEASKDAVHKKLGHTVYTDILPASDFFPVPEPQQDYKTKSPMRYTIYRWRCGRDDRLKEIWGEMKGESKNPDDY